MRIKKKIISCILAVTMLINVFTGCGDSNEQIGKKNEKIELTGELAPVAEFYDVIEYAHLSNRSSLGKISSIVTEELQAFLKGKKQLKRQQRLSKAVCSYI